MHRRQQRPRVDLSADMWDNTSFQESFLLEETQMDRVSRSSEYKDTTAMKDHHNETSFLLHCTSPISRTSTITMDLLSPASSISDSDSIADDYAIRLSSLTVPSLREVGTDEAMTGISLSNNNKGPTLSVEDDGFTYITLEESKSTSSTSDEIFHDVDVNDDTARADTANDFYEIDVNDTETTIQNSALQTPFGSIRAASTPCYSVQTPFTYETIESGLGVNRSGIASQYTYETLQSVLLEKENTPNRNTNPASTTRKFQTRMERDTLDLPLQSPLSSRAKVSSLSPMPTRSIASTASKMSTRQRRRPNRVDLDLFSVDEYASSPDKSMDCFSVDSYASSCNMSLGIGGAGVTPLDLARNKRDQSLFRLRFLGGDTFQSPSRSSQLSPHSHTDASGNIRQRKDHVEQQRRRLSQVVQNYCHPSESS